KFFACQHLLVSCSPLCIGEDIELTLLLLRKPDVIFDTPAKSSVLKPSLKPWARALRMTRRCSFVRLLMRLRLARRIKSAEAGSPGSNIPATVGFFLAFDSSRLLASRLAISMKTLDQFAAKRAMWISRLLSTASMPPEA